MTGEAFVEMTDGKRLKIGAKYAKENKLLANFAPILYSDPS